MGAESSVQRDGKSQEDAPASASASAGELSAEVLHEGDSVLDSKVQPRLCDPCHCVDHHAQWAWSQTPASHVMRLFFAPALHSPPACLQTYLSSPLLFPSPFSPATFPAPSASCCSALAPCAPDAVVFCWVMGRLVCSPAVIKRQQLSRVQIYIQTSHLGSATHISLCDSFWSSWSWIRLQHIGYNRCTCGSWLHSFSFLSCTFHFSCFHYQTRFCIISTH